MEIKKRNNLFLLGNILGLNTRSLVATPTTSGTHYPKLKPFILNHKKEIAKANSKIQKQLQSENKILIIYACHTNNYLKWNSFAKNFGYLIQVPNSDLVIINSSELKQAHTLQSSYKSKCKEFILIPNNKLLDFGKWRYGLEKIDYSNYKYITFINDSILIEGPINFYFNLLRSKNFDLYGYNNSTQTRFHIQTYLFSIKVAKINKFIDFIDKNKNKVKDSQESVIMNYEIRLTDVYPNHKNFINTREFPDHKGKNIFFNNDYLYQNLKQNGLFPFTKIKRMHV
mgnify:CR=1 FL=1